MSEFPRGILSSPQPSYLSRDVQLAYFLDEDALVLTTFFCRGSVLVIDWLGYLGP